MSGWPADKAAPLDVVTVIHPPASLKVTFPQNDHSFLLIAASPHCIRPSKTSWYLEKKNLRVARIITSVQTSQL